MAYLLNEMKYFVLHSNYLLSTDELLQNFRFFLKNLPDDVPILLHCDTTFKISSLWPSLTG
jgi:hypothetical protein